MPQVCDVLVKSAIVQSSHCMRLEACVPDRRVAVRPVLDLLAETGQNRSSGRSIAGVRAASDDDCRSSKGRVGTPIMGTLHHPGEGNTPPDPLESII